MYALVDQRIDSVSLLTLKNAGTEPILVPPAEYLQIGVASHPDMIFFIGFGKFFCHLDYYLKNKKLVEKICKISKLKLILSDEKTCESYPYDVLFNGALVGKKLICNKKTFSKLILDEAEKEGYEIVSVSQGYTKCSTCIISENAIVTADRQIHEACLSCGIDALLISAGHIVLPGYNYGFIGGASGACGDKVFFCGDLEGHPDGKIIADFCEKHKKEPVSLSYDQLFDIGTIFFI